MIGKYQTTEYGELNRELEENGDGTRGPALLNAGWNWESDAGQRVARSIAYMKSHLHESLEVSTLATLVNVSPSHYFALFKRQTGRPPVDYFTRLRIRQACHLLDTTTASIKEVAAAMGYDDPFYFSRVFKSVSAVAPLHYRNLGFASRQEIKDQFDPKSGRRSSDSGAFRRQLRLV